MKDIRTEIRDTVPDTFTPLSSPHFDEFAIAAAQPVQPLPPRSRRLLRSSLFMMAYLVFIGASVGVAYVCSPQPQQDTSTAAASSETQSDMQPALADNSSATTIENEAPTAPVILRPKQHSGRASRFRFQHQPLEIVDGGEGKPVARKVGEIRYGRSPDRP
jgi:hypothetical protein